MSSRNTQPLSDEASLEIRNKLRTAIETVRKSCADAESVVNDESVTDVDAINHVLHELAWSIGNAMSSIKPAVKRLARNS